MHEHLTTTDEPFISIKCCFVCGTIIRNAVVINTFTLCILLRTCIPMRGQLNHKQEICNPFWSTVSCKLFTTLQYCLVLSESLMATQFYVVEFPSEEEKCRGPYLVPANKVKEENGTTQVLWSVVDELMGSIMEVYYEATCFKQGTKQECSDFFDLLKKNREHVEISDKWGVRSRRKPAKLNDYEFECLAECSTSGKPPTKKAKKATTETPFNTCINERVDDSELFDPETEKKAVMKKWTKEVLSKSEKPKSNGFSRKNSKKVRSHQGKILESSKDHRKRRSTHHKKKRDVKLPRPSRTTLTN